MSVYAAKRSFQESVPDIDRRGRESYVYAKTVSRSWLLPPISELWVHIMLQRTMDWDSSRDNFQRITRGFWVRQWGKTMLNLPASPEFVEEIRMKEARARSGYLDWIPEESFPPTTDDIYYGQTVEDGLRIVKANMRALARYG